MQQKEFNIMLDIKKKYQHEEIEVVQGDYDTNVFNIQLQNELNNYSLIDTNVEIAFAKPDGTTVLQDENTGVAIVNAAEGRIRCVLNTNTIASPGKVLSEVRVLNIDGKLLTSARFNFFVRKSIVNDETLESTNEFPVLNQLITTTQGLIKQVEQIEAQVPENVVTELNQVSTLANQLQQDLIAHEAESASYTIRPHGLGSIASKEYEEGVWTPRFGTAFNGVYGSQIGKYIRKGNEVTLYFILEATTFSYSDAAQIAILGLPFSADNNFPSLVIPNVYGETTLDRITFDLLNPANVMYGYKTSKTGRVTLRPADIGSSLLIKGIFTYKLLI